LALIFRRRLFHRLHISFNRNRPPANEKWLRGNDFPQQQGGPKTTYLNEIKGLAAFQFDIGRALGLSSSGPCRLQKIFLRA
jgi:hypothetical protein